MKRSCSFLFFQTLQQMRSDPPKKRRINVVVGCCGLKYERRVEEVVDLGKQTGINSALDICDTNFCNVYKFEVKKKEREMDIDQSSEPYPTPDQQCCNGSYSHQSFDQYRRPQFKPKHICFRRRRWERKKKQRTNFFDSAVLCM